MSTFEERTELERALGQRADARSQRDDAMVELRTAREELRVAEADRDCLGLAVARLIRGHEADRAAMVRELVRIERRLTDESVAHCETLAQRDKAQAELRLIGIRAGGAVGAIKPDGTTVEIHGPLDAVASLDVYARNLKTRAEKAEAERAKMLRELETVHAALEESQSRAALIAQKRKARR